LPASARPAFALGKPDFLPDPCSARYGQQGYPARVFQSKLSCGSGREAIRFVGFIPFGNKQYRLKASAAASQE
jgi:hypothetical protein